MQSPWERRVRRKNRDHRLSGHCMGGDRCVPIINWKTLPFYGEKCGVYMIPKAALDYGRRSEGSNVGGTKRRGNK